MGVNLTEIFDEKNRLDQKSREFLLQAIEKNNLSGFDYLEFKQALIRLRDLDMDSATAIKTAFATASTVGLTRKSLLDSADFYLSILKNEFLQFTTALENQMESKVHSREKQKAALDKKMATIESKIKELKKEQDALLSKMSKIDEEVEEARAKIDETGQRFEETLDAIEKTIEADIEEYRNTLVQ